MFGLCSFYVICMSHFSQHHLISFLICSFTQHPIDMSALVDGRVKNSRGGNGIGAAQHAEFWKACSEVLLPDSATEERLAKDAIHASAVHSIPNLVKLATDVLKRKVDSKELDKVPPVPSVQWVRLQFLPSVEDSVAGAQFTGRLEAKCAV